MGGLEGGIAIDLIAQARRAVSGDIFRPGPIVAESVSDYAGLLMSKLLLKPLGRLNVATRRALACSVADAAQTTTVAVFMNPERDLYVLAQADAVLAIHAYASWLVGCYTREITAADIADDLRAHEYALATTPRTRRPRQRVGGGTLMS